MRRMLTRGFFTSIAVTSILVGLMAAPALAAKGTVKISSVKGSISGTQTVSVTCGWGTFDFGNGPQFQPFFTNEVKATAVAVNASTLGSGTMSWDLVQGPTGGSQTWAFQGSQPKNLLTGQGSANFNFNGQSATETLFFSVSSGTGKFAGASGGQLQSLAFPADQPFCDPGDGSSGDVSHGPFTLTSTFSVPIYGQLLF